MYTKPTPPPGLLIREATPSDNEALIALEIECPLLVDGVAESYDRSPDFFACHRVQGEHRVILAEMDGRVAGVMAGAIQEPPIQRQPRRLVYIQRARIHPGYQGRGVAWHLANDLFAWSHQRGAEGPYYLIAPGNERSIAFGGRAGRRWPVNLRLASLDVTGAEGPPPTPVSRSQLAEAMALINATHADEDFFQPLTPESLSERLSRDPQYGIGDVYAMSEGGRLNAVAGLWDKGATTEQIRLDQAGTETLSRGTAVTDWGFAPGHEAAFAELLRSLAAMSRTLGRQTMVMCEPRPGMVPDLGLPRHDVDLCLYTPTIDPPDVRDIKGLFADLLTV